MALALGAAAAVRLPLALALARPFASSARALAAAPAPAPLAVTAYARQDDRVTHIVGHDRFGFNVNNIRMRGSVLAFNRCTLLWAVTSVRAVAPRSIAPVHMLRPRAEVCILGTGERAENVNPALYGYLSRRGVALEVMTLSHAIATFNLLVAEGRPVCAALVSREPVSRDDASLFTPDAYALAATPADRAVVAALAADVLPRDRDRLLGDGSGHDSAGAAESSGAAFARERERLELEARAAEVELARRTAERGIVAARARRADIESARIAQQFGYPASLSSYTDPSIFGEGSAHERRVGLETGDADADAAAAAERQALRNAARRSHR